MSEEKTFESLLNKLTETAKDLQDYFKNEKNRVDLQIQSFNKAKSKIESIFTDTENVIELNVGGQVMTTLRSTLTKHPNSMLAAMFSGLHKLTKDKKGRIFIDRNPEFFKDILEYLRTDELVVYNDKKKNNALEIELDYFGLVSDHNHHLNVKEMKEISVGNYQSWAIGGLCFDIEAVKDIVLTGIGFMAREVGAYKVSLYYKMGSFDGFEQSANAWEELFTGSIEFTSKTVGTIVSDNFRIKVPASEKMAFYISNCENNQNTNGEIVGQQNTNVPFFANSDLIIYNGSFYDRAGPKFQLYGGNGYRNNVGFVGILKYGYC